VERGSGLDTSDIRVQELTRCTRAEPPQCTEAPQARSTAGAALPPGPTAACSDPGERSRRNGQGRLATTTLPHRRLDAPSGLALERPLHGSPMAVRAFLGMRIPGSARPPADALNRCRSRRRAPGPRSLAAAGRRHSLAESDLGHTGDDMLFCGRERYVDRSGPDSGARPPKNGRSSQAVDGMSDE
jgi:hypothetical protein